MADSPSSTGSWRFLVDENLPRSLVPDLAGAGWVAEHVYDLGMGGAKDPVVYAYAQQHQAAIITGDKDFSNVRTYSPPHAGVIVVELPDSLPPDARKRIILQALRTLAGQSLSNALVIVEPSRVRVRR